VDIPLDQYVMAALNGDLMTRDPYLPLVAGDTVALLTADAGG
jgi:molybdopterin-guanine dinucleotide biosynthesis protein A